MEPRDIAAIRNRFRGLDSRANESLGSYDDANVGIGRYVPGASPWERHNNGDELLLILDGSVQIEVLDEQSSTRTNLPEGTLFVVPRGRWHQLVAEAPVHILYVSPSEEGVERTRDHPRGGA